MRRRLFIKSGSAAVAVALSGCGGGGDGNAADPAATAVADAAAARPAPTAEVPQSAPLPPQSAVRSQAGSPSAPVEPVAGTAATGPFDVGLNLHTGGTSTSQNTQIASILQARNFKRIRMDYYWNQNQTMPRDLITKIRAYGGSVEMVLQISYQWDHTVYTDLAAVETNAYNQAYAAVNAMKDLVHDYELLNEVQLRSEIQAAVPWNSAGTSKTPYQSKPALANLAATLRGMSRAIRDLATNSGLPLRAIMGVIGRDFGLLRYLKEDQALDWDVTGYHNYPSEFTGDLRTDAWYGTGGPLTQLASFGKPVTLNEFHAGEIYNPGYTNVEGSPLVEAGFRATARHMRELYSQTACDLESVVFYEMLDDPSKPAPENHFGLMSDLNSPKVSLYLATALAGGALSPAERTAITSRALLTDAQIDAMQL